MLVVLPRHGGLSAAHMTCGKLRVSEESFYAHVSNLCPGLGVGYMFMYVHVGGLAGREKRERFAEYHLTDS